MGGDVHFDQIRILVADDQTFVRNLLRAMLNNIGVHKIDAASHGEEAKRILFERGNSIDCVISDWNMEPGDGLQLLRTIRTAGIAHVRSNLPFIMLTGYSTSPLVTAALNLDVDAFIVKPSSAEKLAAALNRALTKTQATKPATFYAKVAEVPLPQNLKAQIDDPAQWAKWVRKGRPEIYENEVGFIRRDSVELKQAPDHRAPDIRNIRCKTVNRIKPGAVLVEKLCDADGVELLVAGTILSEKILKRLTGMADRTGQKMLLYVGELKD
jgi:CheY-like chemotaxis protein